MDTTVFLIRHGKLDNPSQTIYDHTIHLSNEGKEQMQALGESLHEKGVIPGAAVISPYIRVIESTNALLQPYGELGIPIIQDPRLRDTVAPGLVGKPLSFLKEMQGGIYDNAQFEDLQIESSESITRRMKDAFDDAVKEFTGSTLFIVSHGDPTAFLFWRLNNLEGKLPPVELLQQFSDEVTYLEKGSAWKLLVDSKGNLLEHSHIPSIEGIIRSRKEYE